jgi:16S rRNA (guanine966-N2)-methyltransferase
VGRLRIIAGRLKGRRIRVPRAPGIRPTGERVREALFSILGGELEQERVLDLCSGTGALGLEALSRGASEVVFVEADPRIARNLQATVDELGVRSGCQVVVGDAVSVLQRRSVSGRFELIIADPPYGGGLTDRLLAAVAAGDWLAEGGRLVVERPVAELAFEDPRGRLRLSRTARYGDTRLDFYDAPVAA